jgi:hypothetical protein
MEIKALEGKGIKISEDLISSGQPAKFFSVRNIRDTMCNIVNLCFGKTFKGPRTLFRGTLHFQP